MSKTARRFVAWKHWSFHLRNLQHRLEAMIGWEALYRPNPDPRSCLAGPRTSPGLALDDAFRALRGDHARGHCPGSYCTITRLRPVHGGGAELLWGPKRDVELKRILTVLTGGEPCQTST